MSPGWSAFPAIPNGPIGVTSAPQGNKVSELVRLVLRSLCAGRALQGFPHIVLQSGLIERGPSVHLSPFKVCTPRFKVEIVFYLLCLLFHFLYVSCAIHLPGKCVFHELRCRSHHGCVGRTCFSDRSSLSPCRGTALRCIVYEVTGMFCPTLKDHHRP